MAKPSPKAGARKKASGERGRRDSARPPAQDAAERALRESEERFRATFEQAAVGVAHTTTEGEFLQVNNRLCSMLGHTTAELLNRTTRDLTHPDDRDKQDELRQEVLSGRRQSFSAEKRYLRKDGSELWVNRTVTLARRPSTGARYLIQVIEDISERKRTETRLARLTRARSVMAACNHVLIHAGEEHEMLESMCRIVADSGGYKMAWVGVPTGEELRPIRTVAHAGFGGDEPMSAPVAWGTDGRYQGFMWETIATGKPHIARDILKNPLYASRRPRALQHGFQSSIALPLESGGEILGALAIYAGEADAFDDEEIVLLTELVGDIAYGIANLRMRSAREKAEDRSRETERRFRETFEQAAVGLTRVDLSGHLVDLNQKFCDMLGYTREALIGKSIREITHPEDYGEGSKYRAQLVDGAEKSRTGEKRFLRKDGTVLWARRTMSTAFDAAGRPQYVISVVEDITERKATDERYRATFDAAPVGIMHVDLGRRITQVNTKACEILGYGRDELMNMQMDDLIHPGFRDTDRHRYTADMLSGKLQSYASERLYVRKDGSTIWVLRTISLVRDPAGQPLYFVRVIEDISERKEAEERYRATFDNAPVGIMHTSIEDDRILRANSRLCEMTGYAHTELVGMHTDQIIHPDYKGGDRPRYREKMLSGELPLFASERLYQRKDGSDLWLNRTVSLARDGTGKPLYFIRILEDITERKLSSTRIAMEHAVTQVLAESATVEEAMPRLLRAICDEMNWAYGARWICNPETGLHRAEHWADFDTDFDPADREYWLQQGVDGSMVLLHNAWRTKEPTWVVEIEQHPAFRRSKSSRKFGLHSAYAFPIFAGGAVIGVMEFFSREVRQPDEMLLKVANSLGTQVGQFIRRKEAEQALAKSEERYRDVFAASPLPMWVWDDQTLAILDVNQAAIDHYGYNREEFLGITVRDIWEPAERKRYERNIRNRTEQETLHLQRKHRLKDGKLIDTEVTARRLMMDGRPVWLTLVNDVSERRRAEVALRESEEQFRQLAGNIPQVFWIADTTMQQTLYVSPAAEAMLGRPMAEILGDRRALIRAVHGQDRARVYTARKTVASGGYDETYRIVRPDGAIRWVRDRAFPVHDATGTVHRIAGIAEDITERKLAEEKLMHLAHYDVLTSLPNRVLFYDRLRQALAQARRNQWITGVMFMDVDRFKNINDTLGHAVGDRLLQQVSERLRTAVRSGDTVGRLGGDEFAIVLSNLSSANNAKRVAQKIMSSFNEPFKLEGADIYVTTSIGITLYPEDSTDQDTLIKNADAAMYKAKEAGRNAYQFYTREMSERGIALLNMEGGLRRALERSEYVVYYQAKAGVKTGELTGFEALLRWRHPERGLVLPGEFIPVLEETGLIVQVGEWVINAVCAQISEWSRAGLDPVPVAINLSARQFLARDLGASIKRIIDRHRIDPTLVELEITESSLMVNPEEATRTLEYLKALGVGISIDDFGTGYSSLGYLKRFPLDSLKVDRSFVRDVTTDADDAIITRAVITMAHSLGLEVIAEGVETAAQLAFLAENGCDQIQGFYLSRPQPAEESTRTLMDRRKMLTAMAEPEARIA